MSKKSKKDRKPRPQPKPNRQIPISMIRAVQIASPLNNLRHARDFPLYGCWIMADWHESGITPVAVAREHAPGRVLFAVCMVDLTLLGIKDAYANPDVAVAKFERSLPEMCINKPEKCSPELAHEVIYGAMEYAQLYGFQPHSDFKAQMVDLVLDPPDMHPRVDNVAFGRDGKPLYVSGPFDDERRQKFILDTLTRTAGPGNFDFLIGGMDDMPELLDDDDFMED